jgi:TolA-binding protein
MLMLCCNCLCSGCKNPSRGAVAAQFDAARALLLRGRFEMARKALTDFVEEHSSHHLAGRATFLLAKSYTGLEDFDNAQLWFSRTIERFPKSEEAHKARFKLAMVDLLCDDTDSAKQKLARLLEAANGPYVPEARAFLTYLERFPEDQLGP